MLRVPVLALALAMSGCAGADYVMKEYGGMQPVSHEVPGEDIYRIFDKPDVSKLMITPSLAKASAMGMGSGLTWGAADTSIPKPVYERAARSYLDSTNRPQCKIVDAYNVIHPQWEIKYDCSAPPVAAAVPVRRVR